MPGEEVTVAVNRNETGAIEADVTDLEVRDSFELVLESHGGPAHVHCRLTDDLERAARIEQPNYYVEPDEKTYVPITVGDVPREVRGRLEVSTAYGASTVRIRVTVLPGGPKVEVDERLAEPQQPTPERTSPSNDAVAGVDPAVLGVVALGLVALAIAAAMAIVIGGLAGFVGFLIAAVGIVAAAALLTR
ncbi:DUF7524 family protein [Natrononativus amylolyticus]|uniref:DUF7524 family protein n=1 Tax=Natrononativus amylolyticus TaxID=2963434 RepID=UPI0020CD7A6B|nr:hypothetical protein [Natrononativus amylolyticus]